MTASCKQKPKRRSRRRGVRLAVGCVLLILAAAAFNQVFLRQGDPEPIWSETDVPLGVEEAVIIRYSGPRLVARPYRRGASVNLRIADEVQTGPVRVYDVRYVVNLPGQFDITEYLTSADGNPIDDLPSFEVRGLTRLTKDIETRILEIEDVGVGVWHWYHETLVGLGAFWGLWLLGLIFVGRPKRKPKPRPSPPQPSLAERIVRYVEALARGELSLEDSAQFEILLLKHWREKLDLNQQRLAAACRQIGGNAELGELYRKLQSWLHDPSPQVGPEEFLDSFAPGMAKRDTPRRKTGR